MADLAYENALLRKKLDRAMRDMQLLEEAKDRYDALYAQALDSLTASEGKYRSLAENLSEGLATTDPALRLTYFNPAFAAIFGYGLGEAGPTSLSEVAPPEVQVALQAHALFDHEAPREFEFRHRDGSPVHVLLSAAALQDGSRSMTGFLVLLTDIRAHKQVTESRRYAQKMESLVLMAGSIAHDFNNIFQAVGASLEIAEFQSQPAPEAVKTLKGARESLHRATALSWRMMDFSGMVIARLRQLQLPELFAAWASALAPKKEGRHLVMEYEEVADIRADPANIRKLVEAILQNAWEAMDEAAAPEGTVWLRVFGDHSRDAAGGFWAAPRPRVPVTVCLEIANDGPCPGPEVLPRMFDPFFTTKALGRGLGLASALGLLQVHGAGIQVLPGNPRGIAFRIHFPPCE